MTNLRLVLVCVSSLLHASSFCAQELRIPVPNGIIIDSTSGRGCIQLGIGKDLFLLKFKTTEEAEEFKTRAEALKGKW